MNLHRSHGELVARFAADFVEPIQAVVLEEADGASSVVVVLEVVPAIPEVATFTHVVAVVVLVVGLKEELPSEAESLLIVCQVQCL